MKNILAPFGPATSSGYAQAGGGVLASALGAMGNTGAGIGNAMGQAGTGYMQGLGAQGANHTNAYGAYTQGIGDLGRSQTGNFNAYAGGLGQIGQAMAADRAGFYGANAGAEAARQVALGNIGSSALSAFGGASNKALESWAQNQMAYNQALSGLGLANQTGLSQLGQSRNTALGNLGSSYADLGGRMAAAGALSNLNFGTPGSGFNATGPGGEIASGSYGGSQGGDVLSGGASYDGARAYGGLGQLQRNLMAPDISDSMNRNYTDSMNRLDAQHYSSRNMPSQMLGQTLSGLMSLGRDAYGQVRGGMNQFYATQNDPRNRADFGGLADNLGRGFAATGNRLDSYAGQMGAGLGATNRNIRGVSDSLRGGWGDVSNAFRGALDTLWGGDTMRRLFPTEFEAGEDARKNEAAARIKNYTRTYGGASERELLIGDRYGIPRYGSALAAPKWTIGPMGQRVYG